MSHQQEKRHVDLTKEDFREETTGDAKDVYLKLVTRARHGEYFSHVKEDHL